MKEIKKQKRYFREIASNRLFEVLLVPKQYLTTRYYLEIEMGYTGDDLEELTKEQYNQLKNKLDITLKEE